jgi:hypothetical protein
VVEEQGRQEVFVVLMEGKLFSDNLTDNS